MIAVITRPSKKALTGLLVTCSMATLRAPEELSAHEPHAVEEHGQAAEEGKNAEKIHFIILS